MKLAIRGADDQSRIDETQEIRRGHRVIGPGARLGRGIVRFTSISRGLACFKNRSPGLGRAQRPCSCARNQRSVEARLKFWIPGAKTRGWPEDPRSASGFWESFACIRNGE